MRIRIRTWCTISALLLMLTAGAHAAVTVADFQADFTADSNGHDDSIGTGTWTYYSSDTADPTDGGANLTLLNWESSPTPQYGTSTFSSPQVRSTNMHPSSSLKYAMAQWASGDGGTFNISGSFTRLDATSGGDGVDVHVYTGGASQFSASVPAATGNPGAAFNFNADVSAGQNVSFLVGANSTHSFDRTAFTATVTKILSVTGGSFETPDLPSTGDTSVFEHWQEAGGAFGGPGIQTDDKPASPTAPDGDQWAFFNVRGATASEASARLWQNIGLAQADTVYDIDFTLGSRSSQGAVSTFEVELWAGGSTPGGTGSTLIGSQFVTLPTGTSTLAHSVEFTSGGSLSGVDDLWLQFIAAVPENAADTGNHQILLDAVSVSAAAVAIPTPAAFEGAIVLLGLMKMRRHR